MDLRNDNFEMDTAEETYIVFQENEQNLSTSDLLSQPDRKR